MNRTTPTVDPILAEAEAQGWKNTREQAPPNIDSSFQRGLRSGSLALHGQLRAVVARGGETLGATDFAADQYAQAKALEEDSQREAPPVNDYRQVNSLRSGYDYITGKLGQMGPTLAAGLGAAAMTRVPGAALVAATAATAPGETGREIQRQQEDPVAMQRPLSERNWTAGAVGVTRAAVENVVPLMAGARVLGRLGAGSGDGLAKSIGKGVVESSLGNAAAGAASERIGILGEATLNPDRDTSGDFERMKYSAIEGGIIGAPFGVVGGIGARIHSKKKLGMLEDSQATTEAAQVKKMAADEPMVDTTTYTTPEEAIAASDDFGVTKASAWAREMIAHPDVPESVKAGVQAALDNVTDPLSRTAIATAKMGQTGYSAAKEMYTRLSAKTQEAMDAGTKKSEDYSGVRQAIAEHLIPAVMKESPGKLSDNRTINMLADSVRILTENMMEGKRIDAHAMTVLQQFLGDQTLPTLSKTFDALNAVDPKQREAFFGEHNRMRDKEHELLSRDEIVRRSLTDEYKDSEGEKVRQIAGHLDDFASGRLFKGMGPKQEQSVTQDLMGSMRLAFGDKADQVLADFEARHEERVSKDKVDVESGDRANTREGESLKDEYEAPKIYGSRSATALGEAVRTGKQATLGAERLSEAPQRNYAALEKETVTVEVINEGTGRTQKIKMQADEALKSYDEKISGLQALMKCVGGA